MRIDRQVIWSLAIVLGYLALFAPLLKRSRRRMNTVLLGLYVLLSAVWALSDGGNAWPQAGEPWTSVASGLFCYGLIVLSVLLGALTSAFLRTRTRAYWIWGGAGLVLVTGAAVLDAWSVSWFGWESISELTLSEALAVSAWVGLVAVSYLLSWDTYRKTRRPLHRNRLRYWMLTMAFIMVGDGLYVLFGFPLRELGTLLHWLGAALASIALLSHDLPDLSGVFRQILKQVLLVLVSALVLFAGMWASQLLDGYWSGAYAFWLAAAALSVLLAVLFPVLHRLVQRFLDLVLFGRGYDRDRMVQEYSQSISNILDLERLSATVVETIGKSMQVQRGVLFVCVETPDLTLRPVQDAAVFPQIPSLVLSADRSPIVYLMETRSPLTQYDLDLLARFQDLTAEERTWFSGLDVEVYVPIVALDQLLGVLALGAKQSGEPYAAEDLDLLRTLAGQTAVALKNARLVDDLRRLNVEITQLNKDLTATNERLAILDKTKSDFISIASHELKTPLTQIMGYTDMLLEMSGDESDSQSFGRIAVGISKGASRLHSVVEAMLEVSLIEQDAFSIHVLPISLAHVVGQVLGGLEAALDERRQEVSISGFSDLPDIVADETRLHQALRNVIINSVKFTPDGGQITITAHLVEDERTVELEIADTGIGIDPEHHDLVFEKFYRVGDLNLHSTGQIKFKGAGPGLGLPIARGIIEAHGGRIWVESPGHDEDTCPGSTFYVWLPLDGPLRSSTEVKL